MEKLYQDYKDVAELFLVYIKEAHPADGRRPMGNAKKLGINQHTSLGERCSVADKLLSDNKLTIPCLVDRMDDSVQTAYQAWPDRIFLVRQDGTLGVAGERGPWGFKPALDQVANWLAEFKGSGKEPALAVVEEAEKEEETPDFFALSAELGEAYQSKEYEKALGIAGRMLALRPGAVDVPYNIACMHCLLGANEKAYTWLEKAIDAGYRDVDHLLSDQDFESIHNEARFGELVTRIREKEDRNEDKSPENLSPADVAGEWEIEIALRGMTMQATMTLSVTDGELVGVWASRGYETTLSDLKLDGERISFKRTIRGDVELRFEGTIRGDRINGTTTGPFGELPSNGRRKGSPVATEATGTDETNAPTTPAPDAQASRKRYRGELGPGNRNIKIEDGKTYVWAAGDRDSADSKWYDFTGAPFPASQLQFGIGQDRIPAIDDPLFVDPDDTNLLKLPASRYRRDERPKTNDEIMVIGYADGADARAYPAALLDGHELVNDSIGGKPVTIGW